MFTSVPDGGVGRGGSFAALEAHLVLFEHLLRYHDPVLATHLEESRISADAYATPWWVSVRPVLVCVAFKVAAVSKWGFVCSCSNLAERTLACFFLRSRFGPSPG